jgi:hypothetical protein
MVECLGEYLSPGSEVMEIFQGTGKGSLSGWFWHLISPMTTSYPHYWDV